MLRLTSQTFIGLELVTAQLEPQPRLQVLTFIDVSISCTEIDHMVHSYPSVKQLQLNLRQKLGDFPMARHPVDLVAVAAPV